MAVIITVQVTNDDTGEVQQSFAQTWDMPNWHPFEAANVARVLLHRVFVAVYGSDDEWA